MSGAAKKTVAYRVEQESARFRAAVSSLLKGQHAGKWVVFLNGAVVSSHDSQPDAYEAGLRSFGVDGGFVVAHVEPGAEQAIPLTAAVLYGIR